MNFDFHTEYKYQTNNLFCFYYIFYSVGLYVLRRYVTHACVTSL